MSLSDKEQLEWLWANCRIIYYPMDGRYPFEHTSNVNKDMREFIEKEMNKTVDKR